MNPLLKNFISVILILLVIGAVFSLLYYPASEPTKISVTQLVSDINQDKIKKIVEKPKSGQAPSNLAVIGRYLITPEVFDYLKKARPNKKGEIILAEALSQMLRDGTVVYGYEVEGKWLECGDKIGWLRSNLYLSLKHPEFGKTMAAFLKEEQLL